MPKEPPRPVDGVADPDPKVAAALVAGLIVVALLLLVGISGERVTSGGDHVVTVQGLAPAARSEQPAVTDDVPPRGDTPGRRLGERLVLAPRTVGGRAGYAIGEDSDSAVLTDARLRVGDVLFEIDDRTLDSGRIAALGDELSVLDRVEITLERDGLTRSQVIDLTP